mmetsp:Transcript_24834/g.45387  ORF Transcript_24834/g.45387 Transcript_24834/m.45387 type:complete len:212 (-) Transcript_24834:463-1098(-)
MVHGRRASFSERVGGLARHQLVETVRNRNVLDNVNRVQNVAPRRWHRHLHGPFLVSLVLRRAQLHLVQQLADGARGHVHAHDRSDLTHLGFGLAGAETRGGLRGDEGRVCCVSELPHALAAFLVHHRHRLHRERRPAVLAEHGDHGVEHDVRFGQVRRGALDEHVSRVQGDARVVAVDDGGQGHDRSLAVADHGVQRGVPDQGHVGSEMLA